MRYERRLGKVRVVTEQMREGCCSSDPETRTGAARSRNSAASPQLLPALRGVGILELLLLTTCLWVDSVLMILSICTSFSSPAMLLGFFLLCKAFKWVKIKKMKISYILILLHSDFCICTLGFHWCLYPGVGWSLMEPAQRCRLAPAVLAAPCKDMKEYVWGMTVQAFLWQSLSLYPKGIPCIWKDCSGSGTAAKILRQAAEVPVAVMVMKEQ